MKIYGMIGQSNMVGQAPMEPESTDPRVKIYGFGGEWREASEPSHDPLGATDANYVGQTAKFSSLLSFGKAIANKTGEEIGLVPCARNGTAMVEWLPSASRATYYGVFIARMLEAAESGELAGVCFYQGETDAIPTHPKAEPEKWVERFRLLVDSLRHDLRKPFLPIIYVQLALTTRTDATDWTTVRNNQSSIATTMVNPSLYLTAIPGVKMVRAKTLPIFDGIHLSAEGQRMLGIMLAEAF